MKRHPGLVPLSHDHHDVLVVAQGLILGRSKAPRSDWPSDRRAQVARVGAFFTQILRPHFDIEETHLFPAVVAHLPAQAELVGQLRDEHEAVRTRIRDLERDPTTDLDTRLPALGRLLEAHVRREERVLFEAIQRDIAPRELEAIGAGLRSFGPAGACGVPPAAGDGDAQP